MTECFLSGILVMLLESKAVTLCSSGRTGWQEWSSTQVSRHGYAKKCRETMRNIKRTNDNKLTTTIKRPWLAEIIEGTKKIEYREIKPYWTNRLKSGQLPRR
jgi:hypothetical protein